MVVLRSLLIKFLLLKIKPNEKLREKRHYIHILNHLIALEQWNFKENSIWKCTIIETVELDCERRFPYFTWAYLHSNCSGIDDFSFIYIFKEFLRPIVIEMDPKSGIEEEDKRKHDKVRLENLQDSRPHRFITGKLSDW